MYFRWVLGWPYYIYGLLRLFQHIWLTFGWEGGSSSLVDGSGWWRGAVAQGVAHFMLWSKMALGPAFDNSWIRGRSRCRSGVVRGSFSRSVLFSVLNFTNAVPEQKPCTLSAVHAFVKRIVFWQRLEGRNLESSDVPKKDWNLNAAGSSLWKELRFRDRVAKLDVVQTSKNQWHQQNSGFAE